jgi:hypothetical protein
MTIEPDEQGDLELDAEEAEDVAGGSGSKTPTQPVKPVLPPLGSESPDGLEEH